MFISRFPPVLAEPSAIAILSERNVRNANGADEFGFKLKLNCLFEIVCHKVNVF